MRFAGHAKLLEPGRVTRLITKRCGRVVVRMTPFPVRQNHGFRPSGPDFFRQREPVFDGRGEVRIAEIQPFAKSGADHGPGGFRFFRPDLGRTPGAHFPLGEVEDAYRVALVDHLDERARARQFDVVRVRSYGQDVDGFHSFFTFFSSSASSTWYLKALFPLMNTTGICSP